MYTMLNTVLQQHRMLFLTGTDTEVGKTHVSCKLMEIAKHQQRLIFPFKPISAGTQHYNIDGNVETVNEDAYKLWCSADKAFEITDINPIVYDQPIAPHIAAKLSGRPLTFELLDQKWQKAADRFEHQVTNFLIEGAGGWLLPLNDSDLLSDWVAKEYIPVLLVVGVRLGCLNHALLTAQAIKASGCQLVGWVANFVEPETEVARENVEFLSHKLKTLYGVDCLLEVAFEPD